MTKERKLELLWAWISAYSGVAVDTTWYTFSYQETTVVIRLIKSFFQDLGLDFEKRFNDENFQNYRELVLTAFKKIHGNGK